VRAAPAGRRGSPCSSRRARPARAADEQRRQRAWRSGHPTRWPQLASQSVVAGAAARNREGVTPATYRRWPPPPHPFRKTLLVTELRQARRAGGPASRGAAECLADAAAPAAAIPVSAARRSAAGASAPPTRLVSERPLVLRSGRTSCEWLRRRPRRLDSIPSARNEFTRDAPRPTSIKLTREASFWDPWIYVMPRGGRRKRPSRAPSAFRQSKCRAAPRPRTSSTLASVRSEIDVARSDGSKPHRFTGSC
jgi:hypothetical protein